MAAHGVYVPADVRSPHATGAHMPRLPLSAPMDSVGGSRCRSPAALPPGGAQHRGAGVHTALISVSTGYLCPWKERTPSRAQAREAPRLVTTWRPPRGCSRLGLVIAAGYALLFLAFADARTRAQEPGSSVRSICVAFCGSHRSNPGPLSVCSLSVVSPQVRASGSFL